MVCANEGSETPVGQQKGSNVLCSLKVDNDEKQDVIWQGVEHRMGGLREDSRA